MEEIQEKVREKKIAILVFIVLFVGFLAAADTQLPGKTYGANFENSRGESVQINLEIANTTSEQRKGLMNRLFLPKRTGMLFVFDESERKSFWMKNTYIPLDIIFINKDLTIINVEKAAPQPFAKEKELKSYRSEGDALYVVEIKKGFAESNRLEKGDKFVPGQEIASCCITKRKSQQ